MRFRFDGSDYDPAHDDARLTGQLMRIWNLISDRAWRTLEEISAITHDPPASISAQLRHLRKKRFGGHIVEKRPRGDRDLGLWEYRLTGEALTQPPVKYRKEYKVEWIDEKNAGETHEDFFEDLQTALDFLQLVKPRCLMGDIYVRKISDWRHV